MLGDLTSAVDVVFAFAVTVTLGLLWLAAFVDLLARKDLNKRKKLLWAAVIIVSIHIGVLIYFVMRPTREPYGKRANVSTDRSSQIVSELERLHEDHASGAIDDGAYMAAKRGALGLPA